MESIGDDNIILTKPCYVPKSRKPDEECSFWTLHQRKYYNKQHERYHKDPEKFRAKSRNSYANNAEYRTLKLAQMKVRRDSIKAEKNT